MDHLPEFEELHGGVNREHTGDTANPSVASKPLLYRKR
jgi:hypothetical protein